MHSISKEDSYHRPLGILQHLLVSLPCLFSHRLHMGCLFNHNKKTMVAKGLNISDGCLAEEKAQGPGARSDGCHANYKPLISEQWGASPRHRRQAGRVRNPQAEGSDGPQPSQLRTRKLSPPGNHPLLGAPIQHVSAVPGLCSPRGLVKPLDR